MLLRKGAEANLVLETWYGIKVIKKIRIPKLYRHPQLDIKLRRQRTIREANMIHDAKNAGVLTPRIFSIDINQAMIIMEYITGTRMKDSLDHVNPIESKQFCIQLGEKIGKLHVHGIIHGDLTTSNIIIDPMEDLVLIDFGLAEYSLEVEKKGIDLHLLKRALDSTHYHDTQEYFSHIMQGYANIIGQHAALQVQKRVNEIAKRGRYTVK
jgi:TP53 regulating kinase-like protein